MTTEEATRIADKAMCECEDRYDEHYNDDNRPGDIPWTERCFGDRCGCEGFVLDRGTP